MRFELPSDPILKAVIARLTAPVGGAACRDCGLRAAWQNGTRRGLCRRPCWYAWRARTKGASRRRCPAHGSSFSHSAPLLSASCQCSSLASRRWLRLPSGIVRAGHLNTGTWGLRTRQLHLFT
jgi:hypothetical protein